MRRNYAEQLTKHDLEVQGISLTPDARVFKDGVEQKLATIGNYKSFSILYLDENGCPVKIPIIRCDKQTNFKPKETYRFAYRTICLHRAMWAWFNGFVPEGMIVDHKDNTLNKLLRENNTLDKLQLLTPGENLEKDRPESNYKARMGKSYTEEYILEKLNKYIDLNEDAKKRHDAEASHKYRASIAQWKSRLKQFRANPDVYKKEDKEPKEASRCHERAKILKETKGIIKFWHDEYNANKKEFARIQWKCWIAEYKKLEEQFKMERENEKE